MAFDNTEKSMAMPLIPGNQPDPDTLKLGGGDATSARLEIPQDQGKPVSPIY